MNDLKNRNIIVTGASGGIGNSIVKKLYDNGANVLASGTKLEKLEKLKSTFEKIKKSNPPKITNKIKIKCAINVRFANNSYI